LDVFLISNVSGTDIVIAHVRHPKQPSIRATAPASSFCVAYLSITKIIAMQKNAHDREQHMLFGESFIVVSI
tara:strand:+ start:484 stop:699 length:216 start_codon:yes stop_codon:yes gene_type:complete